ncbi:hypothetical protein [Pseudonocardia sp. N23]|uniref:hypothetical protein n=1 Tax=Pseudonocardia sp. N23 TaxID=1987376 RepID=UPI000C023E0D|nr:hypothetical protein [Pseudonocardia sp. N23]GAY10923.1 hypothetical protein TOK_5408 [Pseudonocardia sp. N23]
MTSENTALTRIRSFLMFWYDFIVGDDWQVAVGVVLALALTWGVGAAGVPSWWLLPVAVAVLLPLSLWRASRKRRAGTG